MISKKTFLLLGVLTILGFSTLGFIIIYFFSDFNIIDLFEVKTPIYQQILIGVAYGWLTAIIAWKLVQTKMMLPVKMMYQDIIQGLHLNLFDIIFISLCAGVGEEILFRGAIQPFLGIIVTSILFVAIHGYLNPKNWQLSVYGCLMTIIIIGIGYMYQRTGLYAVMTAHCVIDVYLLRKMTEGNPQEIRRVIDEDVPEQIEEQFPD